MGELAASPPAPHTAMLPLVFVDGDRSVDMGTVPVQPSLDAKSLQAVVAERVGVAPNQISARPRRRVPRDDEAADLAREGSGGFYVQAALRRSRRGGRSRRDKKQPKPPAPQKQNQQSEKKTILKRLSPTDLASLAGAPPQLMPWEYEAQLRELQRQREWYLINTAAPDPYYPLAPDPMEDWSPSPRCHECEAAAAAMRQPAFHWCVRDAVTVGFRSPVGPIQRPPKKTTSPPPPFLGMSVY